MISHKEFMKALKKRTEADLIISRYNLQESLKMVDLTQQARNIAITFQDGTKTDGQCLTEAIAYLNKLYK